MPEVWELRRMAEWRGRSVVSAEGIRLGDLEDVVYDYVSNEAIWIGIGGVQRPRFRTLFAPVRGALAETDHLRLAYSKDQIEGQPPVDFGEGFDSLGDERHLYAYFDVPLDESREVRVLRKGDYPPGLERVFS